MTWICSDNKGASIKKGYRFTLLTMMNILKGATFADEEGVMYAMMSVIFFAKGVVETVKTELGSGYLMFMAMAAMLPIYMKHYYKMKRCFLIQKLLLQYSQSFEGSLDAEMINKIKVGRIRTPEYEKLIKHSLHYYRIVCLRLTKNL
jgi:starch synthase